MTNFNWICCGDIHMRAVAPRYRIDDYWDTALSKLLWIIEYANNVDARVLIAGDLFDSSKASVGVVTTIASIFKEAKYTPYVVAGQHDLRYHTYMEQTPIFNLLVSGVIRVISGYHEGIVGVNFDEYIPDDIEADVLLIHKCITEDEPPFFLEDAISAKEMMDKYSNYKFIISGDYHVPFIRKKDGRVLINCGTMLRNKKDMINYQPVIWHIHGDIVDKINIPIKQDVFDIESIEYDEKHGISIDTEKLKELMQSDDTLFDFSSILSKLNKEMISKGITIDKSKVNQFLGGTYEFKRN